MRPVRHEIHVVQDLVLRPVGLVPDLEPAQPLDPGDALDPGDHQSQGVSVLRPQHLAVHPPRHEDVVERAGHRDRARQPRAVGSLGEDELPPRLVDPTFVEQDGQGHARVLAAGQHAVRVLHRGHRGVAPLHPRVRPALDEVDPRGGREPHQVVHGVDRGPLHEPHDHEPMLAGVDVVPPLMVTLEVQATRRDHAEEALKRGEGDRGRRDAGQARALAPHQVRLVLRGQSVAARRHRLAE